jgi:hypothetical protein
MIAQIVFSCLDGTIEELDKFDRRNGRGLVASGEDSSDIIRDFFLHSLS